ncbi:MAG: hypothetical protein NZ519_07970 [Bacteroidia bacterium]|nr:hypothetical protein [Bacteroidia bacterium]
MRRVGVSPVRSAAQHRSDSVARSTPTLPIQAQAKYGQGHAQENNPFILSSYQSHQD